MRAVSGSSSTIVSAAWKRRRCELFALSSRSTYDVVTKPCLIWAKEPPYSMGRGHAGQQMTCMRQPFTLCGKLTKHKVIIIARWIVFNRGHDYCVALQSLQAVPTNCKNCIHRSLPTFLNQVKNSCLSSWTKLERRCGHKKHELHVMYCHYKRFVEPEM